MDDFDWGSASKREFRRREMEYELRHEEPVPKFYTPRPSATGMIYHAAGARADKRGKVYDFHYGDDAQGLAIAASKGGRYSAFKKG